MKNENCHCHTAAARYRCRHHDPGTGECDRPAPAQVIKEDQERVNDMAEMWIDSMKRDGLSYAQMLQVFALARQKYEALKPVKDECPHVKTYYCFTTGGQRCRKCRKCL